MDIDQTDDGISNINVPADGKALNIATFNLPSQFEADCAKLYRLAVDALDDVLRDPKAPAAARVSAANSVLDRAERAIERSRPADQKELNELTAGELGALVRRLELKYAAAQAQDAAVLGADEPKDEPNQ
jgi:hypothetical protein